MAAASLTFTVMTRYQALIKAKYCPRVAVASCTHKNTHTPRDLDRWRMTLKFSKVVEVVKVHVRAELQQAICSGSWVINSELDFGQLETSMAIIYGTDQAIDKRKTALSTTSFPTFCENNLMNFGPLKKNDLDLWPMTLRLNRVRAGRQVHTHAKYHQVKCSGSWVIVRTSFFLPYLAMVKNPKIRSCDLDLWPIHVRAKFHLAKCSGSWVNVVTDKQKVRRYRADSHNIIPVAYMGYHVCFAGESYSTPKRCLQATRECPAARRLRLWTTGQNVRCTAAKQLDFPANGTDLPFKYAVLEVRPYGNLKTRKQSFNSWYYLHCRCLDYWIGASDKMYR